MASPVVGTILLIGIVFSTFSVALSMVTADPFSRSEYEGVFRNDLEWKNLKEKCACVPPVDESGEICKPLIVQDLVIAWQCKIHIQKAPIGVLESAKNGSA